jgi:hypothetical protein
VYSHCHICNIPIYFFNIHTKHLQYASETSETLETYAYNMCFQQSDPHMMEKAVTVGWRSGECRDRQGGMGIGEQAYWASPQV